MKVLYTPPQAETFYIRIEEGFCQDSRIISGAGGENRGNWDGDDF